MVPTRNRRPPIPHQPHNDSDEIFEWPWLYAVEVGYWELSEPQAKRLREYLDRGGFLMVDDFHGRLGVGRVLGRSPQGLSGPARRGTGG